MSVIFEKRVDILNFNVLYMIIQWSEKEYKKNRTDGSYKL